MLYETWADRTDLVEIQMQRPYRTAYEARLPQLLREPRRAEVLAAAAWGLRVFRGNARLN